MNTHLPKTATGVSLDDFGDPQELLDMADWVTSLVARMDYDGHTPDAVPLLWRIGSTLADDSDTDVHRYGCVLMLDACLQQPGVVVEALRLLRTALADGLPAPLGQRRS